MSKHLDLTVRATKDAGVAIHSAYQQKLDIETTRVRQLNPFSSFFGPLALIKSST